MLDLRQAQKKRRYAIPFGVKLFFLCMPWTLVAYGAGVLQEQIAFYNNSILVGSVVVDVEPSRRPVLPEAAVAFQEPGFFNPDPWFTPSFLYRHENGEIYIGGPIIQGVDWNLKPGADIAVRYNRTKPQEAQPVTVTGFWIASARFIVGGIGLFVAIGMAFGLVERLAADRPMEPNRPRNRRQPRQSVWKRLKLSF